MKTIIVTDSSAGISKTEEKELGIHVLRMPLTIDEQDYLEGEEISREDLIQAMLEGKTVSTSQPNLQYTIDTFQKLLDKFNHIIYLPISKHLSGTFSTAYTLIDEFDGRVTVIDTDFVSWPLRVMSLQAKELVEKGYTPVEVKNILESQSFMYASLIPEDLQYLKRGGRITPAAAAVANLLKIVPVLKVTEGQIDLEEKVRTHRKAIRFALDKLQEFTPYEDYEWSVLNGGYDEEAFENIAKALEDKIKQPVNRGKLYPIVLAHTGPGSIGIVAVKKVEELK